MPIRFVASLWGGIFATAPEPGASTAVQLEAGEPALFAVHGDADPAVPVTFSDKLAGRARDVGVPVEYHRTVGGVHGYTGSQLFTQPIAGDQTSFDRLLDFVTENLRAT